MLALPAGQAGGSEELPPTDLDRIFDLLGTRKGVVFDYVESRKKKRAKPADPGIGDESTQAPEPKVMKGNIVTEYKVPELQRRIKNLKRKADEWEQEQGLNVLYVVFGLLEWVDDDGLPALAPLLLVPVGLSRKNPREAFKLQRDSDDLELSATLRFRLKELDVDLCEADHDCPSSYLEALATQISGRDRWEINHEAYLATFASSKLRMWEDLEELKKRPEEKLPPLISGFAGGEMGEPDGAGDTPTALPREEELKGGQLDDWLDIRDQHTVVAADFSQLKAIHTVLESRHLVLHGPPGTGKSQTITNIISSLLSVGKRVLFVSEKRAALDVVKRNLEKAQLGDLCLDLHSQAGKKKNFYSQLQTALVSDKQARPMGTPLLEEIVNARTRLNEYVRKIHEPRGPLEKSIYYMTGRYAAVQDSQSVQSLGAPPFRELGVDQFAACCEAADRLSTCEREFKLHHNSPWWRLRDPEAELGFVDELQREFQEIQSRALQIYECSKTICTTLGVPAVKLLQDTRSLRGLCEHLERSPRIEQSWLVTAVRNEARRTVKPARKSYIRQKKLATQSRPFFSSDKGEVSETVDALKKVDACAAANDVCRDWTDIDALTQLEQASLGELCQAIRTVLANKEEISRRLPGFPFGNEWTVLVNDVKLLGRVTTLQSVPPQWLHAPDDILLKCEEFKQRAQRLDECEQDLFETFFEPIVDDVDDVFAYRFRNDYQAWYRWFQSQYRKDMRVLRGHLKTPGKIPYLDAYELIRQTVQVRDLRQAWQESAQNGASIFGQRFQDRRTDWQRLSDDITECQSIQQSWPIPDTDLLEQLLTEDVNGEQGLVRIEPERTALRNSLDTADQLRGDVDQVLVECELSRIKPTGVLDRYCETLEEAHEYVITVMAAQNELLPDAEIQTVSDLRNAFKVKWQLDQKTRELGEKQDAWGTLFGQRFTEANTDWEELEQAILWTEQLVEHDALADISPPEGVVNRACGEPDGEEIQAWMQDLDDTVTGSIIDFFDEELSDLGAREWTALLNWIKHIAEHPNEASERLTLRRAAEDLNNHLGVVPAGSVLPLLRSATDDANKIPNIITRAIAEKWLSGALREANLQDRDIDGPFRIREEFRDLEKRFFPAVQGEVRHRVFAGYRNLTHGTEGNLGTLRRETQKQRRQKPVRQLIGIPGMAGLLTTLKPCALMSPLAVSQFLPLESNCFDVVIFDEASQVFPEDAMPTVARAGQIVVVGDQQQLPPTNFFRRQADDEEIVNDEEAFQAEDEDATAGMASILDLMVGSVGEWNIAAEWLRVHYRSRDESLINFSNKKFYSGKPLLVFPGARRGNDSDHPIRDIHVPNAVYEPGTRINRKEAEKVVELVFQLMRTGSTNKESIGVIALSRAQAQFVDECIELARADNRDLDECFSNERQEPFFVKNLENVQGDERDHIILTVGYGPYTEGGTAPQRFGPINQATGGRRLNVAVSRARKSMSVVHALRSEQISAESGGAKLLKEYLEYIKTPDTYFEREVVAGDGEAESDFEAAVAAALRARGYPVSFQVGVAGYRIDLGVPDGRGGWLLGIECDGYQYHSSPAARDRDWLREDVLKGLGWEIHRVWSTAWVRSRETELKKIEKAIKEARMVSLPLSSPVVVSEPGNEVDDSTDVPGGAEVDDRPLFAQFVRTDLVSLPVPVDSSGRCCNLATVTVGQLEPFVLEVVRKEGPIHFMEICDRIRERWGLKRSGHAIRANIEQILETIIKRQDLIAYQDEGKKRQKKQERFIREINGSPVYPRRPEGDGYERAIERLALEEIEAGLLCVCSSLHGCTRDELRTRTRKEFGFARTGDRIERRMDIAIKRLLETGKFKEKEGLILLADKLRLVVDNENRLDQTAH
jgi:very-short-patch-repair endonuclease/DNA polymerase III delta prime subunit